MFTFTVLFASVICIFFSFYYPTLSLLRMFQSYNDNLFCGWTSSCFFIGQNIITNKVFCSQKQGSTKNINANLSGNIYGATYFFLARFARSVFKTLINNNLVQVYKILNDIDIVDKDKLFKMSVYGSTRGHSKKNIQRKTPS